MTEGPAKKELRDRYRRMRASLADSEVRTLSEAVSARFFDSFDLTAVRFLHIFLTIRKKKEIETSFFIEHIRHDHPGIDLSVPRLNKESKIINAVRFDPDSRLAISDWGIPEPVGSETISPESIDLVLVPLLCFDRTGHRVGYGGGYYDRFLSECRRDCLKVGISLFPPVDQIAGVHSKDVRLDHCITPDRVWTF